MSKCVLHNMRAGEVIAAENKGVVTLLKMHCRWRTDSAKGGYTLENVNKMLPGFTNINQ